MMKHIRIYDKTVDRIEYKVLVCEIKKNQNFHNFVCTDRQSCRNFNIENDRGGLRLKRYEISNLTIVAYNCI
jgi:hypothetical protein